MSTKKKSQADKRPRGRPATAACLPHMTVPLELLASLDRWAERRSLTRAAAIREAIRRLVAA